MATASEPERRTIAIWCDLERAGCSGEPWSSSKAPPATTPLLSRYLVDTGRARPGARLYIGRDLRDSSEEIAAQVAAGIAAMGLVPVSLGVLPTPALALHAMGQERLQSW